MRDFAHPLERFKRIICCIVGHRYAFTTRGEPVVTLNVVYCKRCGRFER